MDMIFIICTLKYGSLVSTYQEHARLLFKDDPHTITSVFIKSFSSKPPKFCSSRGMHTYKLHGHYIYSRVLVSLYEVIFHNNDVSYLPSLLKGLPIKVNILFYGQF